MTFSLVNWHSHRPLKDTARTRLHMKSMLAKGGTLKAILSEVAITRGPAAIVGLGHGMESR